jgi:hypothetical protein
LGQWSCFWSGKEEKKCCQVLDDSPEVKHCELEMCPEVEVSKKQFVAFFLLSSACMLVSRLQVADFIVYVMSSPSHVLCSFVALH